MILQNVINYELDSNICKHKAFYSDKFIFCPLNSRSFVFLKYPKAVFVNNLTPSENSGSCGDVLGSHRVNSLIFINFLRYPVFFQCLYSSHHYVAYCRIFSVLFLYSYLLIFFGGGGGVRGASGSVQCIWSDSKNLLHTLNSMEDFFSSIKFKKIDLA